MKIRITKVPRQPNMQAYGGYIEAANNLFALGGPDDPPVGTHVYRDVYDPNNPQAGTVRTKEFIPMQPKAAESWEPVANINKDYVPQYGGMYGHIPQGMSKEDGEYYQKVLHDYEDYPITTYSYGYKKGAYQPYKDDYELMNVHNYPNGALGYDIRNAQGTTQYIPTKDGRWFRMTQAANEMGEPTGEYIDTLPEFDFNKYTLKSTDGENYIGNPNLHALGGDKKSDEDLENLMFYLSQKEKYPNGRKKTEAEKFLNYRLGIPERKTAPWFEEMPTYIPESPSEHLDRVIGTASKLVKGIGEQTKKKISQGEPYIPHVKFAFGGNMGTNSADFSTGLTHIDAGQSHEENPNEGVQVGVDNEGTPNLVEEGEVIFNDYVFSNRIGIDDGTKNKFHIGKKREMTYAELAKKLEKEIAERPNDPISKASFKAQMEQLAEQQERQKQEMEAERARQAFEALSPEEQTALMQQAAQQEQMAQEQAMQEQAMTEQAAVEQQPTPEEMAMAQQQQMIQADGSEATLGQAPQMACGGKINRFDKGGVLKLLNSLGYKTVADAEKAGWKPSDFGNYKDWKDINSNSKLSDDFTWTDEFSKRLTSPEQKAMLSLGWNPTAALLNRKWYEGDNGNNVGWTQSYGKNALNAEEFKDYANRYKNTLGWAVENGLIKAPEGNGTISMADITKAMREAPDWKKTDEWLYSSPANMASYLGMARGLNPDDDTKFINKWSPYGSFTKGTDGNWTYNLRGDLTDAEKQSFADLFRKARTDNMVGVMYNNFHDPDTVTNRYLLDEDGNPVLLTGDDLSGYKQLGTYSWGDEANNVNNNAILYRAKGTGTNGAAGNGTDTGKAEDEGDIVPVHRNEKLRYVGLLGPAVGLGMQALGIGRPDTRGLDASLELLNNGVALADYKPIGNYLRYRPMDIWAEQNRLNANARATDRAIQNSGSNQGAKIAGLLSNEYNNQIGSGELYRKALEYNDALRERQATFNRGTDQFNAEAYNRTALQNAEMLNRNRQMRAQLGLDVARQKMAADAAWNQGIYGNVAGLFKGIGDVGRENYQHNRIADMAATGIFGTIDPDTSFIANGYLTRRKKNSRGGKLNKGGRK